MNRPLLPVALFTALGATVAAVFPVLKTQPEAFIAWACGLAQGDQHLNLPESAFSALRSTVDEFGQKRLIATVAK